MESGSVKKVSVVMCTYNGEKYLSEQLDTILQQTYPIHEIIVQDDNSTDGTISILEHYQSGNPLITIYRNSVQKGINRNFFTAMARATGDYIAISDQDDLWVPDKIEHQVASINGALLSAGISRPFTEGDTVNIHYDTRMPNLGPERIIYTSMVAGHTMMIRKELIGKIPELDYWMDIFLYDHLLQIIASSFQSISFYPGILVNQRRHLSSATYTEPNNYRKNISNIIDSIRRTFRNYRILRPQMRLYFSHIYSLLSKLSAESEGKDNAMHLARYHRSAKFLDYIKLSFLCVRLRDKIFHTKEKNRIFAVARAFYFPISCSDYFRYMNKRNG